jgi:hypothetical protein
LAIDIAKEVLTTLNAQRFIPAIPGPEIEKWVGGPDFWNVVTRCGSPRIRTLSDETMEGPTRPVVKVHLVQSACSARIAREKAVEKIRRFNNQFAIKLTAAVGTMWCAYFFTLIALRGLPGAIQSSASTHGDSLVQWFAQTFVQLVLLSVIMVGQNLQSANTELRDGEQNQLIKDQLARQERHITKLIVALGVRLEDEADGTTDPGASSAAGPAATP